MQRRFVEAVNLVPWAKLEGCHGASDGSSRSPAATDVPRALLTLATWDFAEPGAEEWEDVADILYSHVTHQGSVFEVTSHVVPLVVSLVIDCEFGAPAGLAAFLPYVSACARRARGARSEAKRAYGEAIGQALEAAQPRIMSWDESPALAPALAALAVESPSLRSAWLARAETRPLTAIDLAALTAMKRSLPGADRAARAMLEGPPGLARTAAAYFLEKSTAPDDPLAGVIDAALGVRDRHTLQAAFGTLVPIDLEPPRAREFSGPLEDGTVAFRGEQLFVVARRSGGNVTVRWSGAPVAKGERVRVGVSADGVARVVELGDGSTAVRREFDAQGRPR